jgi:hypothetical protein
VKKDRKKRSIGIGIGALLMVLPSVLAFCGYRICMSRALASLSPNLDADTTDSLMSMSSILSFVLGGTAGFLVGLLVLVCLLFALRRAGMTS